MICRRPEIDNDVISGVAVDNVGVDVPIKFGDSRSNRLRDIRGADFVSNERKLAYPNSEKRNRVSPKNKAISFPKKIVLYRSLVLSVLLYGCESLGVMGFD